MLGYIVDRDPKSDQRKANTFNWLLLVLGGCMIIGGFVLIVHGLMNSRPTHFTYILLIGGSGIFYFAVEQMDFLNRLKSKKSSKNGQQQEKK